MQVPRVAAGQIEQEYHGGGVVLEVAPHICIGISGVGNNKVTGNLKGVLAEIEFLLRLAN